MSTHPASAVVADPERRFQAFAIDRVIAWTFFGAATAGAWWWFFREGAHWTGTGLILGAVLVVSLVFAIPAGLSGCTPGKALRSLKLVDADGGGPIGVPRSLLRSVIVGAGSLPMFGLGVATLAWTAVEDRTRERRGWHDHVVGSIVIDVRPQPVIEAEAEEKPRHVVNLTAMRLMPVRQGAAPAVPTPMPTRGSTSSGQAARQPELPAEMSQQSTPEPVAHHMTWRITLDSGESLVVEGLGILGRAPVGRPGEPVRHVLPLTSGEMSISKTHAQFHLASDGALVVTDRGSTNGSILVRKGVSRELAAGRPTTLVDGDRVVFGDRSMHVTRER